MSVHSKTSACALGLALILSANSGIADNNANRRKTTKRQKIAGNLTTQKFYKFAQKAADVFLSSAMRIQETNPEGGEGEQQRCYVVGQGNFAVASPDDTRLQIYPYIVHDRACGGEVISVNVASGPYDLETAMAIAVACNMQTLPQELGRLASQLGITLTEGQKLTFPPLGQVMQQIAPNLSAADCPDDIGGYTGHAPTTRLSRKP